MDGSDDGASVERFPKHAAELSLIGAALKDERRVLGLTQVQVAQQFNVSLKAIRNLEQGLGGVSLATAIQIFEYLGKELRVGDIVTSPAKTSGLRPRREKILATLRLVQPVLKKKFQVDTIALFGSCARDKASKNSDIDLAVKFKGTPTFESLGRVTAFLETLFDGQRVDLVEVNKMRPEVARSAKKEFIYV